MGQRKGYISSLIGEGINNLSTIIIYFGAVAVAGTTGQQPSTP